MPGFSFSPAMIGKTICIILKSSGLKIAGEVMEVNPAEVVMKHRENNNLIRINRDEIEAYTGFDDIQRKPEPITLHITRCYNTLTRCNGVKKIDIKPCKHQDFKECPAINKDCQFICKNFFDLTKDAQAKLLKGFTIGEFPQSLNKKRSK